MGAGQKVYTYVSFPSHANIFMYYFAKPKLYSI